MLIIIYANCRKGLWRCQVQPKMCLKIAMMYIYIGTKTLQRTISSHMCFTAPSVHRSTLLAPHRSCLHPEQNRRWEEEVFGMRKRGVDLGWRWKKKKKRSFFMSICLISVLLSPYTPPPELYISNARAWLPFNVLISHKQKTDHAAVTLTQVWSAPLVIYRCWEKNRSARVHAMSPFVHWGGTWLTAELKCRVGIVLTTRCDGNDFWVITVFVFVFVWVMWPYWRDVCLFFYHSGFRKIPTPVQNDSRDWYCHYIVIYILPSHKRADIKYTQKHLHIHTLCAQQALTRLWEMTGYRGW